MLTDSPRVSVVVPVRRAESTVGRTIEELLDQIAELDAEIIAVVAAADPSRLVVEGFSDPRVKTFKLTGNQGVPQLRREGVRRARGRFVAITEDHCSFPAEWLKRLIEFLENHSEVGVCGGPVANGHASYVGWAQYFTRYNAFLPPAEEGETSSLPGNNACYRREAFEQHDETLSDGFWEFEFNSALSRQGALFWMMPDLAVVQRQHRSPGAFASLRARHGRCFAARRSAGLSAWLRSALFFRTAAVPVVLLLRASRQILRRPSLIGRFLFALPLTSVYLLAWSMGEAFGYCFGAGASCRQTD